jgi:NAD(P)-dependent dehydrogenase (short-subunit alcohol dehydrogenase family)
VLSTLRPDLLAGVAVALHGEAPALRAACERLGAAVAKLELRGEDVAGPPPDTLVCATGPAYAAAGGGLDGLRVAGDAAFLATRAVANAWIAAGRGGKVVLVAPGPEAGPLRAALENLARTLSVEWARFDVRTTAILPGAETTDEELGTLVAYLASPAGDYYSGCALALGGEKVRG